MWITVCTFLPLVTAAVITLIPGQKKTLIKSIAVLGASATLLFSLNLLADFNRDDNANLVSVFQVRLDRLEAGLEGQDKADIVLARAFAGLKDPTDLDIEAQEVRMKGMQARGTYPLYQEIRDLELAMESNVAEHIRSVEYHRWIPSFGIHYFMGIDGLSLPLFLLTALLGVICLVYSWNIEKATKGYFALFLLLETGLLGVFCALDFFLFYVFWEVVLLPMYFLIGIWGGPRRIYAATKFFIYTLVGSVIMLIAMLALYFQMDPWSFNMIAMMSAIPQIAPLDWQMWIFGALFIAFAIKIPSFPFHTWLPDAHVQAPTAVSVVLAGVLLKMGGYGIFRVCFSILPAAATSAFFVNLLITLALISMLYGALCAMAQTDFKSLVAYSSISHMGYVLLGVAAGTNAGMQGAALQMFNHGLSSAMLFLLVGVVYERAHHRDLAGFGGMALQMPNYTFMAMIGFFASLGLPGLCGFISEALVFLGAYQSETYGKWVVFAAVPTVVLTAGYILWTIQRVFLGKLTDEKYKSFPDLNFREWFALLPLGVLCLVVGVWPKVILDYMNGSLMAIVEIVGTTLK